ncbi:PaaI family thioesterase [Cellulomonas sp. C5510]|uniref:PaaI family thioesterase n=1 Tax=Cellulomonas sp. C5510 TaxID=2871170 RepID=UPI001C940B7C|nr:PaaI family thioesterase [Cellulomonas sp. C5510]
MSDTGPHPIDTPEAPDGAGDPGLAFPPGTLMERLGMTLLEVTPERAVGTLPVAGNTQPYGLLHGGASAALAETLGSYAAAAHAGPGRRAVGIELSCTHHRSATDGVVTGTATAVHLGGRVATYDVVVEDPRGRRVCSARLTCMLIDDRPV